MVTDEDIEEGWRYMKERGFKMTPGIEAAINRYLDSLNYLMEPDHALAPSVPGEATGEVERQVPMGRRGRSTDTDGSH